MKRRRKIRDKPRDEALNNKLCERLHYAVKHQAPQIVDHQCTHKLPDDVNYRTAHKTAKDDVHLGVHFRKDDDEEEDLFKDVAPEEDASDEAWHPGMV